MNRKLSETILTLLAIGLVTIRPALGDAFVELTSTNSPRFLPTATLLTNGQVLVAGGGGDPIFQIVATTEMYDPPTLAWSSVGSMSTPRVAHRAVLLPSGKVLVAGGSNNDTNLASAELYDPFTKTWTVTGFLCVPRFNHQMALLTTGKVLVAGGFDDAGEPIHSAELFDPVSGT